MRNSGSPRRWGAVRLTKGSTSSTERRWLAAGKLTKNRGSFPSDEALTKLFYLALRNISQKWTMPIRDWKAALTRFTIQFGNRISVN